MPRTHLIALVAGCFLSTAFVVGCSGGASDKQDDSETTGQLGTGAPSWGCSNALIRQMQAVCAQRCVFGSLGLKSCATDDPNGQGGNVEAPCDCVVEHPNLCGDVDQPCCNPDSCYAGLSCVNAICAKACVPALGDCVSSPECCGGLLCIDGACQN